MQEEGRVVGEKKRSQQREDSRPGPGSDIYTLIGSRHCLNTNTYHKIYQYRQQNQNMEENMCINKMPGKHEGRAGAQGQMPCSD